MKFTLEIDHALSSEKTEKLEDEIKGLIQERFDHRMVMRSEKTGNELSCNAKDPGVTR